MKFLNLNRGLHKRLFHYYKYQIEKKHFRHRARVLVKNLDCSTLSKAQIKEAKDYYASFGFHNIDTEWHRYFTYISGKFYKEYIPVDLYITVIEPCLNMRNMYPALTDKNLLNRLFNGVKQPETIIKNINGVYVDADQKDILQKEDIINKCNKYSKLVIKPSIDSGGGKNIIVFKYEGFKTDHKDKTLEEFLDQYDENFIIQNYLEQHPRMSILNPTSVNTLRIQTLLIHNRVEVLVSFVRIGNKESMVDNISDGGLMCTINQEGLLNRIGYNGKGEPFLETDTHIKLEEFEIPNYTYILGEVKKMHLKIPYFKLISWDIAIDQIGDPVLIEYNIFSQGINFQHTTGPLFGKFTREILTKCNTNMFAD